MFPLPFENGGRILIGLPSTEEEEPSKDVSHGITSTNQDLTYFQDIMKRIDPNVNKSFYTKIPSNLNFSLCLVQIE